MGIRSDKFLWENICMNIYRQMYKEATPSADFDELIKSGEASREGWFLNYYLPMNRQKEIIDFWCRKFHCNKYEIKKIETEIYLGSSPSGYKGK